MAAELNKKGKGPNPLPHPQQQCLCLQQQPALPHLKSTPTLPSRCPDVSSHPAACPQSCHPAWTFTAGIELEFIIPPQQSAPRIEAAEELGALELLKAYAGAMGMSAEAEATGMDVLRVRQGPALHQHGRQTRNAPHILKS